MLFNPFSPPQPADPIHIGPQAASVYTPADEADTGIRTAFAARCVFGGRDGISFSWRCVSVAVFLFLLWFFTFIHRCGILSGNKKGRLLIKKAPWCAFCSFG